MLIDQETLTLLVLGSMEEAEAKALEKKIKKSPKLQKQRQEIENSLSTIAYAEKPCSPSDSLRESILAAIQPETRFQGFIDRFSQLFDIDKKVSKQLLAKIDLMSKEVWEKTIFPGVTIMKFQGGERVSAATCGIVHVEAGSFFPAHQHQDNEENLVLQGWVVNDKNTIHTAGDQFILTKGSQHSFKNKGKEAYIFAVVLHKDNKWLWFKTAMGYLK